jgi:hypothetical protein
VSLIAELLDRLSGVAVVRERLGDAAKRVDALADRLVDHERRITRLETLAPSEPPRGGRLATRK